MAAGYRPSSMGARGQPRPSWLKRILVIALILLIVLPVVGYFAVPAVRDRINGLIDQVQVAFATFRNPSSNAIDRDFTTAWLADANGTARMTVTFGGTTDLAGFVFHTGPSTGPDFTSKARPRQVELIFPGDPQTVTINLEDIPGLQRKCLPQNRQVATFDIRVLNVYPAAPGNQNLLALREVEFISRSC